jgi:nicotinate-nucleotide adenylyltransferase
MVFVPAGRPWQKSAYSDPEDRFMMTMLAAATHPSFEVSRVELDRRGPTYTADTMGELHSFLGSDVELFFVAGADAVEKLGTWVKLEELGALTELIAVTRPGYEVGEVAVETGWPRVNRLEMPPIGVSATDIRARVRAGRPIDFIVPKQVVGYIRTQGLYVGGEPVEAG